jgi:hemin uptake protein HemP
MEKAADMNESELNRQMEMVGWSHETAEGEAGCLDSETIFGDRNEILIRHGDQTYRLRKTRHGKLILNK